MLNAKKKFGIGLTLAGMALLLLAFLSIPFAWEMRIRWLLLGGIDGLPQIGGIAVAAAVYVVAELLLHLRLDDLHGAHRSAQRREKIHNGIAALEI